MVEISAAMVKALREKTQAGMMDCKKALVECEGDMEKATDTLRKKGLAAAGKKASRAATEGAVGSYIHAGGKIGVLVEINCETDFVAKTSDFQDFVKDIAMHIAASSPLYVRREDVPEAVMEREKGIFTEQARQTGKPEAVLPRIVGGMIEKFYADNCLLEQKFIKDPNKTVQQHSVELVARIGENIAIRRFTRFVLGEGLEKRADNFAEEVAAQAGLR